MGFHHINSKWGKLYNHAKGVPGGGGGPTNTVAPAINAAAVIGTQITGDDGTWTGTPTSYAYQWKRGVTNVGTNANTYTVVAGDAANNMTCVVTATNGNGSTAAPASNAIAIP